MKLNKKKLGKIIIKNKNTNKTIRKIIKNLQKKLQNLG